MDLTPRQQQQLNDHVLACYPQEACGVITADAFIPLANVAETPERAFAFDPVEYARVIDDTLAIVHSHCRPIDQREVYDLRTPSRADRLNQRRTDKPWLIVGCEGQTVTEPLVFPRTPSSDYLGRPFIWYINDCYTLVQDYYQFELGITLPGHADAFDWQTQDALQHLFDPYIADYGFVDVDSLDGVKNGDLLLLNNRGLQFNHLGIVHHDTVIHQLGLSCAEHLSHYRGRINRILRHAD